MFFAKKHSPKQRRQNTVGLGMTIALVALTGCSNSGGTKAPQGGGNNTNNPGLSAEGTWQGSCAPSETKPSTYEKSVFVISGGSYTMNTREYSDSSCATETSASEFHATFTVGAAVGSPSGAYELNKSLTKILMTLKTQDGVNAANQGVSFMGEVLFPPTCGGGFTINVPKELNATTCAGDIIYGSAFGTVYDIVKIDGDKLYLGESDDENDMSESSKRPKKLQSTYFTKQSTGGNNGGGTTGGTLNFDGNWVGACQQVEGGMQEYYRSAFTIAGGLFSSVTGFYSDENCSSELEAPETFTTSVTVGQAVAAIPGAYELNMVTDDGTLFNLIKLDGDRLYFGEFDEQNDGSTITKRPKILSNDYYARQGSSGGGSGGGGGSSGGVVNYSKYVGQWQSSCGSSSEGATSHELVVNSIEQNGMGSASLSRTFYSQDCLIPLEKVTQQLSLQFTGNAAVPGAQKVEFNTVAVQVTNYLAEPVIYCSQTLSPNQTVTFTEQQCEMDENLSRAFDPGKDIVKVVGNMLYRGICDGNTNCSVSYPSNLDRSYLVRKVDNKPVFSIVGPSTLKVGDCAKYTLKASSTLASELVLGQIDPYDGFLYSDQQCNSIMNSPTQIKIAAQSDSVDFYFRPMVSSAPLSVMFDVRDASNLQLIALAQKYVEVQNTFEISTPNTEMSVGGCYPITVQARNTLSAPVDVYTGGQFGYWGVTFSDPFCGTRLVNNKAQIGFGSMGNATTFYFMPMATHHGPFSVDIGTVVDGFSRWTSESIMLDISGGGSGGN